jgi:hypothetical protein
VGSRSFHSRHVISPEPKARVVDAEVAVASADDCVRYNLGNLLSHDADVGLVAPPIAEAIEFKAVVRDNFLKKKLGLTNSDAELDQAIKAVADKMKGDRTKNRVTVYYFLAEHFGKLSTLT